MKSSENRLLHIAAIFGKFVFRKETEKPTHIMIWLGGMTHYQGCPAGPKVEALIETTCTCTLSGGNQAQNYRLYSKEEPGPKGLIARAATYLISQSALYLE